MHRSALLLLLLLLSGPAFPADGQEQPARAPLLVVASFSILGDFVAAVGGDEVELAVLVGPDSDAHLYQPTPADSRLLRRADLVVMNGLGFEGWMERLIHAAEYRGMLLTASEGVTPLYVNDDGAREPDPHAWQSVDNAMLYVRNISAALQTLRPAAAALFRRNEADYLARLAALEEELQQGLGAVPPAARDIVTSHDAFGYLARAYGLRFHAPLGLNTDSEASAQAVSGLIRQIRQDGIRAVFVENITDPRLLQRISAESGARIGGVLYSDALSEAGGPAGTYIDMQRHNLQMLLDALQGTPHPHPSPGAQP